MMETLICNIWKRQTVKMLNHMNYGSVCIERSHPQANVSLSQCRGRCH